MTDVLGLVVLPQGLPEETDLPGEVFAVMLDWDCHRRLLANLKGYGFYARVSMPAVGGLRACQSSGGSYLLSSVACRSRGLFEGEWAGRFGGAGLRGMR